MMKCDFARYTEEGQLQSPCIQFSKWLKAEMSEPSHDHVDNKFHSGTISNIPKVESWL